MTRFVHNYGKEENIWLSPHCHFETLKHLQIHKPQKISQNLHPYIRISSLYIRTGIRRLSAATQYVAIRCATIALSYWIAHVRIGSCKFLLVPIVFSSHHNAIVLILHHHRTASYCIVSHRVAIYSISLHRFNSCLIRVWFALIRK